ncbi:MAG: 8-amino-7-oxononanoate synthase [Pirellulaceae bacterium]|nr:8-amino-7-oxononanoate synthase [Pirellulaceae bacterium]
MTFEHFQEQLDQLRRSDRLRQLVPRTADANAMRIILPDGRELINFGSNDYLGLAAQRTASTGGADNHCATGSMASALVCGWTTLHQELADKIASFESTESAVLFPSGFAACSGTVATLAGAGDLILSDQLNHASLIDGCRLSRAECVVYPHRDVTAVARILHDRHKQFAHIWIVTDGVFSMDGHVAPLCELCDVAEQYDAHLMVDEAHATGLLGQRGSGLCEAMDVKERVAVRIGTLSKAIGSQGGFVAGPQVVIDYLINRCRSLIYSTSLAPTAVQAAINALDTIGNDPTGRQHVAAMSRLVRERLAIPADAIERDVPIIPLVIGDDAETMRRSAMLCDQGFFVPAIRPPTVPPGTARLRISLSAAHDRESIDALLDVLESQSET